VGAGHPELDTIYMLPVIRTAPMLLTMIVASMVASGSSLLLILVLKTLADVIIPMLQHSDMQAKT